MAEINLEDLMAQKSTESATTTSLEKVEPAKEITAITQQIETLTPAELSKVESIKGNINLMDSSTPCRSSKRNCPIFGQHFNKSPYKRFWRSRRTLDGFSRQSQGL